MSARNEPPRDQREAQVGDLEPRVIDADDASTVKGGYTPQRADGSLDAGIHFKYDLKAQKEA